MELAHASIRRASYFGQIILLAAVYFGAAKLALLVAIPPGYATAVWPPSGIALAAVLLLGNRVWPGVWIGAALVNLSVQSALTAAIPIACGNTLEALAGALLVRRYIGLPHEFQRGEDVVRFVAIAVASAIVAATIGVGSLGAGGTVAWDQLLTNWSTWLLGDTAGIIIFSPLILSWARHHAGSWSPRKVLELLCFGALLLAATFAVFGNTFLAGKSLPLAFVLLPLLVWAALRFSQREVTTASAMVCAIAVWYTLAGRGPFAAVSVNVSLLVLEGFVSTIVVTGLVLWATVGERSRALRELRQGRDELASRVEASTRELQEANRTLRQDLGARALLQQQLAESEQRFRLLIDGIEDYAIMMLDPEGKIISWNAGAERMKGWRADEIIGEHFSRFYPAEAVERNLPDRHLRLAKADGRFETEAWRVRKDNSSFWGHIIITPLYDADGILKGFAKVTRDMTARKRVEVLEQGERRMNEFLAMLGHELRNPLAPIRNALDLMQIKPADERTQEWSRAVIDRQLTQLSRLVDDLLDVSRITSGKVALQKEPLEFNAAVLRAVESSRLFIDARGHALEMRLSTAPVQVDADLTRLSQVVLNLLNNAAKYTPNGGRIWITVGREGDQAVLRVRDTGIGMSADLRARVFDLFVQGDRSLDRSEGGLGIGLTLVKRLVEMHGGSVQAMSDGPGLGSEFVVRLPLLTQRLMPAAAAKRIETRAAPHSRRILVVDDNRDSANTLAAVLQAWGHEVRTIYNGREAIPQALQFQPDLVLLDIGLPGMNGYQIAKELRASDKFGPITLVAFTGYGQDEDQRRVREAGFDHHLIKPVDHAVLAKIIDSSSVGRVTV